MNFITVLVPHTTYLMSAWCWYEKCWWDTPSIYRACTVLFTCFLVSRFKRPCCGSTVSLHSRRISICSLSIIAISIPGRKHLGAGDPPSWSWFVGQRHLPWQCQISVGVFFMSPRPTDIESGAVDRTHWNFQLRGCCRMGWSCFCLATWQSPLLCVSSKFQCFLSGRLPWQHDCGSRSRSGFCTGTRGAIHFVVQRRRRRRGNRPAPRYCIHLRCRVRRDPIERRREIEVEPGTETLWVVDISVESTNCRSYCLSRVPSFYVVICTFRSLDVSAFPIAAWFLLMHHFLIGFRRELRGSDWGGWLWFIDCTNNNLIFQQEARVHCEDGDVGGADLVATKAWGGSWWSLKMHRLQVAKIGARPCEGIITTCHVTCYASMYYTYEHIYEYMVQVKLLFQVYACKYL